MTTVNLPRPELCEHCQKGEDASDSHCRGVIVHCLHQRELWDSGYAAALAATKPLAVSAHAGSIESEAQVDDLSRELTAEIEAHRETREAMHALVVEANGKLGELVRRVREFSAEYLRHNRHTLTARDLERILDKYAKPEGP